ncbi:MAG: AAA family ATPase, partial [Rhizobacter sp.]|nr:AAA family ATPase [Chlorobiales bacterium]
MYLSKLEVFGFKSFAQRVGVKFDSGLTAIVGPNGCGKTNIVDAIRWVLGEQKTSVLRSDKMENVIFNGTKSRKPLGMSEVSITIENTKNILPTEYTEVTITRRLYRSGDSEYLLNKVPCRLKDIVDLFVDTGMGSDAYSVIELKMIEQILSENADERRKLFEEAAGITKYKQRRRQTFKKLETTEQDLSRVKDIVIEVEKKVASLERQADKAEKARSVKEELRTLEIELAERT